MTASPQAAAQAHEPSAPGPPRTRADVARSGVVGAVGVVTGLVPHLLHHVSLLAGTALVAGSGGTALFGVVGLVASVPMLLQLKRRFDTWIAPLIGLAVSVALFALSAFVIGPAINGEPISPAPPGPHAPHHHTVGPRTSGTSLS